MPDNQPNCNYDPYITEVDKGESFNVSLVAVDQVNHTMMNVIIHRSLNHVKNSLGDRETVDSDD